MRLHENYAGGNDAMRYDALRQQPTESVNDDDAAAIELIKMTFDYI